MADTRAESTTPRPAFLLALLVLAMAVAGARGQSCPNVTAFNKPFPSQTATFLDITFTCIYNGFSSNETIYQFVPSPFILVEPGDKIGFFTNPPDLYDIVEQDGGTTLSLAHNPFTAPPSEPTSFVITWPANQLERLRLGSVNATLLLAEGFTNLKELNVTGELGGLEAFLSTEGPMSLVLRGRNLVGTTVLVTSEATELAVDIQTGVGDTEVTSPRGGITGAVHAVRQVDRTGNVYLDGVQSIESTGLGEGMLFADDCDNVEGRCSPLNQTLATPDTNCRSTDVCLVTARTLESPVRTCTLSVEPDCIGSGGGGNPSEPGGGSGSGAMQTLMLAPAFCLSMLAFVGASISATLIL